MQAHGAVAHGAMPLDAEWSGFLENDTGDEDTDDEGDRSSARQLLAISAGRCARRPGLGVDGMAPQRRRVRAPGLGR